MIGNTQIFWFTAWQNLNVSLKCSAGMKNGVQDAVCLNRNSTTILCRQYERLTYLGNKIFKQKGHKKDFLFLHTHINTHASLHNTSSQGSGLRWQKRKRLPETSNTNICLVIYDLTVFRQTDLYTTQYYGCLGTSNSIMGNDCEAIKREM